MRWVKSKIGESVSNTAIMAGDFHIAKYMLNGAARYCLWDCSEKTHKQIKWFDDADSAKKYAESLQ